MVCMNAVARTVAAVDEDADGGAAKVTGGGRRPRRRFGRPAAMKQTISKASTTARASRFCSRPGEKLERMNCFPSRTTVVVFTVEAPLRSGGNARQEAHTASPLSSQTGSVRGHSFR